MKVIHISAECYPIAKVGGLADVVGALPKYQSGLGIHSSVIMPFYDIDFSHKNTFETVHKGSIALGSQSYDFSILTPVSLELGYELFLVDIKEFLFKPYIYSDQDGDRFLAFQIAALEYVCAQKEMPDLMHCHDHHSGLIPFMMSHCKRYEALKEIPSVLTIHNAHYQGSMPHSKVDLIPAFEQSKMGLLEWNNEINSLAAAIKCAWRVTTVSMSYLEELKKSANGLESLIASESQKCLGILNGIDSKVWNPAADEYLIKNYSIPTIQSGKKANKKWLCTEFGLDMNQALIVFIGRLVNDKGADLFSDVVKKVLKKTSVSLLFLGSGDKETEKELLALGGKFKGSFASFIGYDESLAHKMYAGGDFLLMPSRVEPCGLNQMYAMAYATIPIVNSVGGLKDTVVDIDEKGGFGICIDEVSVEEIAHAIERAHSYYLKTKEFRKTRTSLMKIDHSWDASAKDYIQLYHSIKAI